MVQILDVLHLVILMDRGEPWQRIPDPRRARVLLVLDAGLLGGVLTIRLGPRRSVVLPPDVVLVKQVGQIGPGVERIHGTRGGGRGGRRPIYALFLTAPGSAGLPGGGWGSV